MQDLIVSFAQLTRGFQAALLLVSAADQTIAAANPAARHQLDLTSGHDPASLWSVFQATEEARAYVAACGGTLDPVIGALRQGDRIYRCSGWRTSPAAPYIVLRLAPREEANRFALLSQNIEELNAQVKQRRLAEETLSTMQSMTAELAAARLVSEITRTVLTRGLAALGAAKGSVMLVNEHRLEVVDAIGYPAELVAQFSVMGLDDALPAPDAVRSGQPVILASGEELQRRYPSAPMIDGTFAVLPLRASDRILGAVAFSFDTLRPLSGSEIERLRTVSVLCAQALDRALLYEAATLASRRKDEFLAMLGHELRNPLAPIHTALELMRMHEPSTFARERDIIERHAHHLTVLVDDMLDVTRIARGKFELHRSARSLRDTLQRAIATVEPALDRKHHVLAVEIAADDLVLDADHDRIAQVVTNLLENACKYTPTGGRITLRTEREADTVHIAVRDNGRGIAADLLPRIFEAFVQDSRSGARTPGGLGLGLAIVKGIVELHGGTVTVHSAGPGTGSEFVVRLPGVVSVERAAVTPRSAIPPAGVARVLVVDDNEDAAELLASSLAHLGHTTRVAVDGPSALRLVQEFAPDVALVDLGMPVMDGFELCQRLREIPALRDTRIVAITGYGQASDRDASRTAGFDEHLVKPVTIERVARVIAALCRDR